MDTTTVVIIGLVILALVVLAVLFRRGRSRGGLEDPARRGVDLEGRRPAADAARPGEGDPGKSARSAEAGTAPDTERVDVPGRPPDQLRER